MPQLAEYVQLRLTCRNCGDFQYETDRRAYWKLPMEFVPCPKCQKGHAEVVQSCRGRTNRALGPKGRIIELLRFSRTVKSAFGCKYLPLGRKHHKATGRPKGTTRGIGAYLCKAAQ